MCGSYWGGENITALRPRLFSSFFFFFSFQLNEVLFRMVFKTLTLMKSDKQMTRK